MILYVPESVNLEAIVPKKWFWDAAYLVNVIYRKDIERSVDSDGFCSLHSLVLREIMTPKSVAPVIKLLEQAKLIIVDWSYIRGEKTRRYKMNPEHRLYRRIQCEKERIRRNIKKHIVAEESMLLSHHHAMSDHIKAFSFDESLANRICETLVSKREVMPAHEFRRLVRCRIEELVEQMNSKVHVSVSTTGRFLSPVVTLPSSLRECFTLDGEPVYSLDLKNCQPLLVAMMAQNHFTNPSLAHEMNNFSPVFREREGGRKEEKGVICWSFLQLNGENGKDGKSEMVKVCESGKMYECFVTERLSREAVKKSMMLVMYDENRHTNRLTVPFANRFPMEDMVLRDWRRSNYKRANWLAQSAESVIFIDTIAKRLTEEFPNLPFMTVHDSFITSGRHMRVIQQVCREVFGNLGVSPSWSLKLC